MSECTCRVCCDRRARGLPSFAGQSAFRDVHVTADELPAARNVPARIVGRGAPYPPEAYTRELATAIAEEIGVARRDMQQQIDALKHELSLERRLSALEARGRGAMSDEARFVDLPPDWRVSSR
jgi:hypothetical protein